MRATAITIGAAALALAACTSTGKIDGHRIRGAAEAPAEKGAVANDLHKDAPAWVRKMWRKYLKDADGRYAVLAVDKNGRGGGYAYCIGGGCGTAGWLPTSWKDVNFKHKAIKSCREDVRRNRPAVKPECAIYAIEDKIVWEGAMPWE